MGLPSGAFSQRVTLQRKSVTRNGIGEEVVTWVDHLANIKASVDPLRSREWFAAAQMQDSTDHKVTIRYRTGITRDMRVVWRGQAMEIIGEPINVGASNENLELMCASGIRNG